LHWHDGAPTLLSSIFDGGCEAINFQQPLAGLMPHKVIEPALVDQPVKRRPRAVSNGFELRHLQLGQPCDASKDMGGVCVS
jgi:hypothetical protein